MMRSPGMRLFVVGVLTLILSIPALIVADIIDARADYNRSTARSVGAEWGGSQTLNGPVVRIPVTAEVTEQQRRPVVDPLTGIQRTDENGVALVQLVDVTKTVHRPPVFVLPDMFKADMSVLSQERSRGIFTVPVYSADLDARFSFGFEGVGDHVTVSEELQWDQADLLIEISTNKSLRGDAQLTFGRDGLLKPEPLTSPDGRTGGLIAALGDPRGIGDIELRLGVFGSGRLQIAPVGRANAIHIQADWPHPSFTGAFLPGSREITDTGFSANWDIPHLARPVPQIGREDPREALRSQTAFGVSFYQPNDFYQKSYRAARYGLLFIALTFLGIFLADRGRHTPAHPVQYLMIGASQLVFFLLMLALAEQIGFGAAYLGASAATIGLITLFSAIGLRFGRACLGLGAGLCVLYGTIYLILQSTDYALLAGACLAFLAIALTMWLTRNETWHGDANSPGMLSGLFKDPQPPMPGT